MRAIKYTAIKCESGKEHRMLLYSTKANCQITKVTKFKFNKSTYISARKLNKIAKDCKVYSGLRVTSTQTRVR